MGRNWKEAYNAAERRVAELQKLNQKIRADYCTDHNVEEAVTGALGQIEESLQHLKENKPGLALCHIDLAQEFLEEIYITNHMTDEKRARIIEAEGLRDENGNLRDNPSNREGDKLTKDEKFIFDWQYRRLGGFKTALINVIKLADQGNRELLRRGFPDEVGAYEKFAGIPGWWDEVEAKVDIMIDNMSTRIGGRA